jgi:hypothetical protein
MEKLCAIGCGAFCQFVLSLVSDTILVNKIFTVFAFALFALFVFSAEVIAFSFANEALGKVGFAVLTGESQVGNFLELVTLHTKFLDFVFGSDVVKVLVALIFVLFLALCVEGPLAVTFAKDAAFGLFAQMTQFFQVLFLFGLSDLVLVRAFFLFFLFFFIAKNIIVFLGTGVDFLLLHRGWDTFLGNLKLLDVKLLETP